jgi:hypothetical protein
VSGQLHASPVPFEQEAGWALESVCMLWRREKPYTSRTFLSLLSYFEKIEQTYFQNNICMINSRNEMIRDGR